MYVYTYENSYVRTYICTINVNIGKCWLDLLVLVRFLIIAFNIMSATYNRLGHPSHSSIMSEKHPCWLQTTVTYTCKLINASQWSLNIYAGFFTLIGLAKSICKSKTGYPKIFCHCLCLVLVIYCMVCNY